MKRLIYNILDKSLIIIAIFLGLTILAIWILPFFRPFPWQIEIDEYYYDTPTSQGNLNIFYDDWPPH